MQKWIRCGLYAGVTAGFAAGSVGVANADDTTVVAPTVKSESTSVIGDNSILGGNSLSAPIVAPITGNDVAVAGIGGAVNADSVLAVLGVLGVAHASSCGSDDYTEVAGNVVSRSTAVVGDNSIGSGNTASVPVYAPITDNKVAIAGIGGAVNAEDVAAVAGILGHASCGDDGDNGHEPYDTSADTYAEDVLPLAALPAVGALPVGGLGDVTQLVNVVGVDDLVGATQNLPVGDVGSVLGLGLLGGAGLPDVGQTATGLVGTAASAAQPVADQATQAATGASTQSSTEAASTTEASASSDVAEASAQTTTHAVSDDTTVVAPTVKSESTSVVGDNSIASGNSLSLPIVAPVTGNDVAVAGIGGAVNAEDVSLVAGVLGTATALLGN